MAIYRYTRVGCVDERDASSDVIVIGTEYGILLQIMFWFIYYGLHAMMKLDLFQFLMFVSNGRLGKGDRYTDIDVLKIQVQFMLVRTERV